MSFINPKIKSFRFEDAFIDGPELNEAEALEQKKAFENIATAARKCLNHADFNAYKVAFEKEKDSILNAMIAYTNNFCAGQVNIEAYAASIARYLQRVMDLRMLLRRVELDAQKGDSNEQGNS